MLFRLTTRAVDEATIARAFSNPGINIFTQRSRDVYFGCSTFLRQWSGIEISLLAADPSVTFSAVSFPVQAFKQKLSIYSVLSLQIAH